MTTKLTLYQGALRALGERKLSGLSETREARYLLDDAWDDDFIDGCLQMGQWKFAMRTSMLDYSPSIEPDFGYTRAFVKPDDFIRIAGISSDEFFECPLGRYADEAGYWFAEIDTIYVKYVSNDAAYGNDYSLWPVNFKAFVELNLASKIVASLTNGAAKKEDVQKDLKAALSMALATDAQAGPPSYKPRGFLASLRNTSYTRGGRGPFG